MKLYIQGSSSVPRIRNIGGEEKSFLEGQNLGTTWPENGIEALRPSSMVPKSGNTDDRMRAPWSQEMVTSIDLPSVSA